MNEQVFQDCLERWNRKDGLPFWQELADKHNYSNKNKIRHAFTGERKQRGISGESVPNKDTRDEKESSTYKEKDDSIHIVCASRRISTKDEIIEYFNIDTDVWKVDNFEIKTSEGYRKDRSVEWDVTDGKVIYGEVRDSGKMLVVPLTHTRTKFIRRTGDDITFDEIDKYFEKKKGFHSSVKVNKGKLSGRRLAIELADLHIGSTDFGVVERAKMVIEDIILETSHLDIELIYLVPLGDTLHYDTAKKTTTGGTVLEYGMTPYDMWDAGADLMIWIVDRLASIAPVELIGIYGNHDRVLSYTLFRGLQMWYRNIKGIMVDTEKKYAKYREFGKCLCVWHHADMNKKRLENLVLNEAREAFGRTKYSELHGAHEHHEKVKDLGNGIIVRQNPTIASPSEWEILMGYAGLRSSIAYAWDEDCGIKGIFPTNL